MPNKRLPLSRWLEAAGLLSAGALIGSVSSGFFASAPRQVNLTEIPPPPRIERSCAVVSATTAVIVVHGQSNAANYGSTRYAARGAVDNFDFVSGKCFAAVDPLLGTDGAGGNFATRLGDLLIEAKRYDRVVIVPIAVQGASLAALDGDDSRKITEALSKLRTGNLTPTHILFQQGENDAMLSTTPQEYVDGLRRIVGRFRAAGIDAPFYVARSSKCDVAESANRAAVRAGQLASIDDQLNIRLGPDTDVIGNEGRNPHDGCHMNELGTIANAALWAAIIQ